MEIHRIGFDTEYFFVEVSIMEKVHFINMEDIELASEKERILT